MKVVAFPHRAPRASSGWSSDELHRLIALSRVGAAEAQFAMGATERGDPQFYLLDREQECVLCVSRLGQTYVLEDGEGRLIGEAPALGGFAVAAARAAMRKSRSLVARVTLLWVTVRLTIEEKLEPILEESEEMLVRFAPQIAALV
jgi:hypothetical protein